MLNEINSKENVSVCDGICRFGSTDTLESLHLLLEVVCPSCHYSNNCGLSSSWWSLAENLQKHVDFY